MKTAGIIAALDKEIARIKEMMDIKMIKNVVGTDFYIGSLSGRSIVAVKCGIGKVNAAIATQALIDLFAVDYVVNTGVAGGIYRDIKIGDIVISTKTQQHDFDCIGLGFPMGIMPHMENSIFEADEELISAAKKAAGEICGKRTVYAAPIASGDVFVASVERKKEIWEITGAYCAEMEGAAIAQACALNKIPFVIIRAVSDNADGSGSKDFIGFLETAAEISSMITERIIEYV